MLLSEDQIAKFQEIYRQRLGKEIDKKEAYEKGTKLLRLMQIIYRPMTIEEYERFTKHRKES